VNMPNIMPLEIVVVSAGFLVLCVAPALVGWVDASRRRRAAEAARQPTVPPAETTSVSETAHVGVQVAPVADEPADLVRPMRADEPAGAADVGFEGGLIATAAPTSLVAGPTVEPAPPIPQTVGAVAAPHQEGEQAPPAYEFCLQDLRRARILDLPPPTVRNDAERHRLWQQGLRLAGEHQGRIESTRLASPYMPQSACYGLAEAHGSALQLRFWLFRDLWPVNESQAVGDAVFELDGSGTDLRCWVEPHKAIPS
jgi:hypothetical protein